MKTDRKFSGVLVIVALLALQLSYGCCPPFCGGGGGQSTTGSLAVTLGFGAVSSAPYQCSGQGSVTIRDASGVAQPPQTYSYSGYSSNTSPACTATVSFSNLQPGSWKIQDSGGANCQRSVTAGQFTSVLIRTDVGVCQ